MMSRSDRTCVCFTQLNIALVVEMGGDYGRLEADVGLSCRGKLRPTSVMFEASQAHREGDQGFDVTLVELGLVGSRQRRTCGAPTSSIPSCPSLEHYLYRGQSHHHETQHSCCEEYSTA